MPRPTPQTCNWCGNGFTGSDCLGKPCHDCRDRYQIKTLGVCRDAENDSAMSVIFNRPPTNSELREIHNYLRMVGQMIKTPTPYELKKSNCPRRPN